MTSSGRGVGFERTRFLVDENGTESGSVDEFRCRVFGSWLGLSLGWLPVASVRNNDGNLTRGPLRGFAAALKILASFTSGTCSSPLPLSTRLKDGSEGKGEFHKRPAQTTEMSSVPGGVVCLVGLSVSCCLVLSGVVTRNL